jgi:Domain of unknown function (DUF4760)
MIPKTPQIELAMSLMEFSRDIVPILQFCVSFVGLLSILLLWWQLRLTTRWNKLTAQQSFFEKDLSGLFRDIQSQIKPLGIDLGQGSRPLGRSEAEKILADENAYFAAKKLLNEAENICAYVQVGSVDKDLAYALESARIIKIFQIFQPLVLLIREQNNDNEIFIETQKIALEWQTRHLQIIESQKSELEKLQAKLEMEKGIGAKV